MIDREQVAAGLGRLDPRHREVLDYSLRRRVPDADLGHLFSGSPGDVARLRAAAVEALSNELGVERGDELGAMLKQLLEPATWELVPRTDAIGQEPAGPVGVAAPPAAGHRPVGAEGAADPAPPPPSPSEPAALAPEKTSPDPLPSPPESPAEAPAGDREPAREPVLDMLVGRGPEGERGAHKRSRSRRVLAGLGAVIAVLAPAGVVAALAVDGGSPDGEGAAPAPDTRPFAPEQDEAAGEPFPSDPESAFQYPVARTSGETVLYDEPDGTVKARIAGKTEWRSPRVLAIVEQRDEWLAVLAPELRNGEVGWIRRADADSLDTVSWSVRADLSKRLLVVRQGARVVRRFRVGVGRKGHSTPTGRFAVTDKLRVSDEGSPYGCCVVALTGHQTRLPEGWPGGDRLAVHATSDTSGLGEAVSLGCMRSDPKDARWLMETVPLGTPVFIRG
jgi:hypothetical protein